MRQSAAVAGPASVGSAGPVPVWITDNLPGVAENLALDELLLDSVHEGSLTVPVVRTWMASSPTVVLGASSRVADEVDLAACAAHGVGIVRRPSGGLTVILGPGCLMWSVIAPYPEGSPAIDTLHACMLEPLAAGLRAAGRAVVRRGASDLALATMGNDEEADLKVSGNALRVRRQGVLYHGTLLDSFDLGLVDRVLRHPPREPGYRAGRPHGKFLANLGLGRDRLDEVVRSAFHAVGGRVEWRQERIAEMIRDRYKSPGWTHRL